MKRIVLLTFLFFSITACFGQYTLKKANRLFDEMAYVDAAKAYKAYIKAGHRPTKQIILNIADTYYYTNKYSSARSWYKRYKVENLDVLHFNRYIQALRITKKYDKANEVMRAHLERKGDDKAIERFEKQKRYLDSINNTELVYTIKNIEANTDKADFGTAFYGSKIVYSSGKDIKALGGKVYQWNEQPFLDLYAAVRDTITGEFVEDDKFMPKVQTRYHNACVAFTSDLQTIYYSTNTVKKRDKLKSTTNGTNNICLIKGTIKEGEITKTKRLPFNSVKYSVSHPAITPDGKWLFFVSDMPGGYGETDIYVVEIKKSGTYGKPKNLGAKINTEGKEMFPFVEGDKLYFSSNGHYGLGGLDVFESDIRNMLEFSEPKNLGFPVNSNRDDFAYIIDSENGYGYFSSNRSRGKGDDDIYYFTKKKTTCSYVLTGVVTDAANGEVINDAVVKVQNNEGKVIYEVNTDEGGMYVIKEKLPCDYYIAITASKIDYSTAKKEITTPGIFSGEIKIDLELSKYKDLVEKEEKSGLEKIKINPIYFDFDKYDITPQGAKELDKVVFVLENFPDVEIKIESHTDSRGSDEYNMKLSQNRATATYNYILSKAINPERIENVKGYGESQLINKCSNGVDCSKEDHLLNRRSEFIIVRK
ncbi:MAG: hypothetical protein BM557_04445 [Flavobacterium sp. MedPE-SWcel]|uniref:OmpA family protein n=1 Tax=uncultured Flavobacterium sp. TaxID=165435 RepID=UPI00091558DB|nr:OmpA family protein [uncultured Flavobacterium sp.]OIQ21016.1 MAG: hypothetical protein BM557_04445 [Flavobacterium sp. MedPE-SWcel]